jgi:uncharacterized protein YqkB
MPIKNISFSQKQERLFDEKLSIKLNPKNKLYKLRELVSLSYSLCKLQKGIVENTIKKQLKHRGKNG